MSRPSRTLSAAARTLPRSVPVALGLVVLASVVAGLAVALRARGPP